MFAAILLVQFASNGLALGLFASDVGSSWILIQKNSAKQQGHHARGSLSNCFRMLRNSVTEMTR